MKITRITEQKIVQTQPRWPNGPRDAIALDVCLTCGAVVLDVARHLEWHEANAREGSTRATDKARDCTLCGHPESLHGPTRTETWCIARLNHGGCDCPGYNPNSRLRIDAGLKALGYEKVAK